MSSQKFHLGPNGPGTCSAQTPATCKYSMEEGHEVPHYDTIEEAQTAFEKKMNEANDGKETLKKASVMSDKRLMSKKFVGGNRFIAGKSIPEIIDNVNSLKNYEDKQFPVDKIFENCGIPTTLEEIKKKVNEYGNYGSYSLTKDGKFILEISTYDENFHWQNEGDLKDEDYLKIIDNLRVDAFKNNENINFTPSSGGYYGEEPRAIEEIKIPSHLKNEISKIFDANQTRLMRERANNPKLPKWAVLPVYDSFDKNENGGKFEKNLTNSGGIFGDKKNVGKIIPKYPQSSVDRLNAIIHHEEEHDRLNVEKEKVNADIEDHKKKIENFESQIESYKMAGDVQSRLKADLITHDVRAVKNNLKNLSEKSKNLDRKIKESENVKPGDIDRAKKRIEQINVDHVKKIKEHTIYKLSLHYPSSDEDTRMAAARKWVEEHPDLRSEDWNNNDDMYNVSSIEEKFNN